MSGLRSLSSLLLAMAACAPGAMADFFGPNWFQQQGVHVQRKSFHNIFAILSLNLLSGLVVTMKVPAIPEKLAGETLFIWPGIQPGNALSEANGDPAGVDNGVNPKHAVSAFCDTQLRIQVLQPVLTWGPS